MAMILVGLSSVFYLFTKDPRLVVSPLHRLR